MLGVKNAELKKVVLPLRDILGGAILPRRPRKAI